MSHQTPTAENVAGLPESRCGLANSPGHQPHPMTVTGEWPLGVPHRWCVGYVTPPGADQ